MRKGCVPTMWKEKWQNCWLSAVTSRPRRSAASFLISSSALTLAESRTSTVCRPLRRPQSCRMNWPYLPMSADRKALLDKACFLAALSGGIVVWVDKVREMTVFPDRWGCGVSIIFLWKGMTRRARRRRKKLWKRNLPEGLAQGIGRMVLLGHNTDW